MKNILLITSLYPSDDIKLKNNTSVCHSFAKEWKALGYNVRVLFLYNTFPNIYYPILKCLRDILANRSERAVLDIKIKSNYTYNLDGIKITRIPIQKNRPGGTFKTTEINRISAEIIKLLCDERFVPNYILGHFLHPSLEIISQISSSYQAISAISLHGKETKYKKTVAELIKRIHYIGYRSIPIRKCFESIYGSIPHFYCPSGVPEEYIIKNKKQINNKAPRFIYVGTLIKRKYPVTLIPAIKQIYQNQDFSITYVGEGKEKKNIRRTAKKLKVLDKVHLCGHISRADVCTKLDNADIFIMISEKETFGLVYLEAMARGCIVIASRNEGMEGIVEDSKNGFLCNAGDIDNLTKIIGTIKNMTIEELDTISQAALSTAKKMTDKIVARNYIEFFNK